MDEFDALWERLDPATDVPARYAEVLTRHLPTISLLLPAAARRHRLRRHRLPHRDPRGMTRGASAHIEHMFGIIRPESSGLGGRR